MNSQIYRSASRAAKALLSVSRNSARAAEGQAVAAASATSFRGKVPSLASVYERGDSQNVSGGWAYLFLGVLAFPALAYIKEVHGPELGRTFIAIKPDGVQRGLIAEIISRFEQRGYRLVAVKLEVPTEEFAQKHYRDLKERPFFNGLCDLLSSRPVLAMVWEGEGVIKYGRKLIGATDPQKLEPGTIRGDLAVVVGRNVTHGRPESAIMDEINLLLKREAVTLLIYGQKEQQFSLSGNVDCLIKCGEIHTAEGPIFINKPFLFIRGEEQKLRTSCDTDVVIS